jgi:hypothetical protein
MTPTTANLAITIYCWSIKAANTLGETADDLGRDRRLEAGPP